MPRMNWSPGSAPACKPRQESATEACLGHAGHENPSMLLRLAAILFVLTLVTHAALPPKATDYAGTIVAVNEKAITVQGKIGTRVFQIYPGTIFGKGASQKLAD